MMVIDSKFEIGQLVYLRTDIEQYQRIVYGVIIYKDSVLYRLAFGMATSDHYEFEISFEPDTVLKTT
jgi:hypothetical protein